MLLLIAYTAATATTQLDLSQFNSGGACIGHCACAVLQMSSAVIQLGIFKSRVRTEAVG